MLTKSFLRWAGSKQKLVPQLKQYWGTGYNRYIEPFMGSSQLFFSINPKNAILSDLNSDLVEVYKRIQTHPYSVHAILKTFPISKKEYYKIRALKPRLLGINQRAARFIYLNCLCFNGLYRTNQKGEFNVPYAGSKVNKMPDLYFLNQISEKLEGVQILQGDFESIVLSNVRPGDFVYLDPPFAVENRRIFKQYGPQTFGLDDLERIRNIIERIDNIGASFLLSYAYCREAIDLFSRWNMRKTFTQRNIAGFSTHRRKAAELLISNVNHS
jgi:DNA adenine methylase